MEIAILGGTGALGRGLALRFGRDTDHSLVVGSRDRSRAVDAAAAYRDEFAARGATPTVEGRENVDAVAEADVAIAAVPAAVAADAVAAVGDVLPRDAILVSPVVPLRPTSGGLQYDPPEAGSATAVVAASAPEEVPVVGAFHGLPAGRLSDLDRPLDLDTLVVGDDPDARASIAALAEEVGGLRALDAGPLANAPAVESVTALLVTLDRQGEVDEPGVRFE